MSIFKDMLGSGESLFKNENALDLEFVPKILPYREEQQKHIATCIKPLLQQRNGKNLFIYGKPGVGKTAAMKWVFRDLENETDEVLPLYINCWQKNTTYKIALELCSLLGYKFTQNKNTEELFEVIKSILNKKSAVFAFDEIDKVEDFDFLYSILEGIYKRSVFLVTNYKEWLEDIEPRVLSRLTPETLEFRQYNKEETRGILKQRVEYAFVPNVWNEDAFELIVEKAADLKDIRHGLYLLRQAGLTAEENSSRKIILEHANKSVEKLSEFTIKKSTDLEEETRAVLNIVKENSGKRIGELYSIYKEKGGFGTYKTFQRRIEKLHKNKFITASKITGGKEGTTTIISYEKSRKITEF